MTGIFKFQTQELGLIIIGHLATKDPQYTDSLDWSCDKGVSIFHCKSSGHPYETWFCTHTQDGKISNNKYEYKNYNFSLLLTGVSLIFRVATSKK